MSTILQRLGTFTAQTIPEQLPHSVIQRVRLQHLNLAGTVRALSGRPLATALEGDGAEASVRRHASLGGLLEMDDVLLGGQTGVGAVPVSWALCEDHSISELITAVALANEVAGRIGAATLLGPSLGATNPMVVAAAAATAAARLLGLSAAQCSHAIALAIRGSGSHRQPRGVCADGLLLGAPALAGLQAAQLARDGVREDLGMLEDTHGPLSSQCWLPLRAAFTGLGAAWLTETLAFKLAPLALHAQVPVQATAEILRRHIKAADKRLRTDQVERIEIRTTALTAGLAGYPWTLRPTTVPRSLRHAIGVLVTANELTPKQLTESWLSDNRDKIGTVAARVSVISDPARTASWLSGLVEVAAPLFAGVTIDELRGVLRRARATFGAASTAPGGVVALLRARPDRLLEQIRYSTGDLADARLDELQFRCDTEVKLFTTRGGSWPERRAVPEGSPGWSWQDTVERVLARHGAPDADSLLRAAPSAKGRQWVASILKSSG